MNLIATRIMQQNANKMMGVEDGPIDEDLDEESAIQRSVDKIWSKYDEDESGELDFEETFQFIKDLFGDFLTIPEG